MAYLLEILSILSCNFPHFVLSSMSLSHFRVVLYAVCFVESVVQNALAPSLTSDQSVGNIPTHLLLRHCTFTALPRFKVAPGEGVLETDYLFNEI